MVKNILLIRHCQATVDAPEHNDFKRPLTTHGLKQAELLGEHLATLDIQLDAVYYSPSLRTTQTIKGIIDQLDYQPRLMDSEETYEATVNVLKAMIVRFDKDFDRVALVGHNPSITALYNYLSGDFSTFSPGTMAWLSFEVSDWASIGGNSGVLKDFKEI